MLIYNYGTLNTNQCQVPGLFMSTHFCFALMMSFTSGFLGPPFLFQHSNLLLNLPLKSLCFTEVECKSQETFISGHDRMPGARSPSCLNNKKTGINILKSGFQTLHNKLCRTMSPEKKGNKQSQVSAPNNHLNKISRPSQGEWRDPNNLVVSLS